MAFWRYMPVAAALSGIAMSAALAQGAPAASPDPTLLPYMSLTDTATLADGRRIHFTCMGKGSPTVILTAGMGDWGVTWNKVQPEVAKKTRVCAWDRPGFGFSDASAAPQTITATTDDLGAALDRGGFRGPFVLVGHSLGGLETLLLADRRPHQIAGMVLVDPSVPDQTTVMKMSAPALAAAFAPFMSQGVASLRRCSEDIRSGKVAIGTPDPGGCLQYPPNYPPVMSASLAKWDSNPARLATEASLIENFERDATIAINPRRRYGSIPLIVLSATEVQPPPPGFPAEPLAQMPAFQRQFFAEHDRLATLSTRGANRLVAGTSHYIQQIKPEAVIQAVDEAVDQARQDAKRP
jgi:pimeloyl-ACP methyl ester carboxylesterase